MSWNVLADELAHTHRAELYPHTQPRHLEWPFRLAAVVRHVAELRPDVLCLQEVDDWAGLQRALSGLGYEGVHMQRTGGRGDGCATLWLRDRLCVATAAAAGQQQLLQPPPQQPRQLQPPLPQQQPQVASAASAASGVVSGSGSGSGSGGGVYKIRMCDHDLRDNVALLVHLRPLTPREAQQQQARRQKQEQRQEASRRRRQQQRQPDEQDGSSDMEISEGGSSSTSSGGEQGQFVGQAAAAVAAAEARRAKRTRGSCEEEAGVLPRSAAEAAAAAAMSALRPYSAKPGAVAAVAGVTAAAHMGNGSRRAVAAAAAVSVALGGSLQQQQQQAAGRGSAAAPARGAHAAHSSERGGDGGMDTSAGPADAGSHGRVLPEHINRGFLVANTHVLFNTKRGDIKLGQLRVILNELVAAAAAAAAGGAGAEAEAATSVPTESGGATGVHRTGADAGEEGEEDEEDSGRRGRAPRLGSTAAHLPCVFAGDFNTAPGSGLYRYLRSGRLELAAEDRRELSGQVEGYGYASLQRDILNGRRPRLERWAPPPQPPQQPPEQQQQQQDRQAERAAGQQGSDSDGDETSAIEQWRLQQQQRQQQQQQQQQQRRGGYGGSGGGGLGGTAAGEYGGGGGGGGRAAPLVRWDLEDLTYAMGQQAAMEAVAAGTAAVAARYGTDSAEGGGWMLGAGGGRHGWGRGGGGGGGRGRGRGGGQAGPPPGWWEAGGAAAAVVSHPLQLRSAYAAADASGREPLFTTLHHRYVGTVDFVWFTPGAGPLQQQVLQPRSQEQRQRSTSRDRRQGRWQDQACGPHGEAIEAGAKQKQRRQRSRHRGGDLDAEDAAEVGEPRSDGWRLQPLRVLLPPDPLAFPYGMPCATWPSDHVSLVVDFRLS